MRLGGNLSYCDRVEKCTPIVLGLVCVRPREFGDRLIEFGGVADIARQRHRVAGSRMRARQGAAAEAGVERQCCCEPGSYIGL